MCDIHPSEMIHRSGTTLKPLTDELIRFIISVQCSFLLGNFGSWHSYGSYFDTYHSLETCTPSTPDSGAPRWQLLSQIGHPVTLQICPRMSWGNTIKCPKWQPNPQTPIWSSARTIMSHILQHAGCTAGSRHRRTPPEVLCPRPNWSRPLWLTWRGCYTILQMVLLLWLTGVCYPLSSPHPLLSLCTPHLYSQLWVRQDASINTAVPPTVAFISLICLDFPFS